MMDQVTVPILIQDIELVTVLSAELFEDGFGDQTKIVGVDHPIVQALAETQEDRVTWSDEPDPWRLAFTPGVRPLRIEVGGEVVFDGGRPTRVDPDEVKAKAAEQAERLFARL